jgi:hypothetical protein
MRLDPQDPMDVYFALRLAFVDRPDVRIRLQDRMTTPGSDRFAPDPSLWCVDAYVATDDGLRMTNPALQAMIERQLVQAGSLDRSVQDAGVGATAMLARDLYEAGDSGLVVVPTTDYASPHRDRPLYGPARRFAAEVLAGETGP